jgi:hypothetical protein
MSIDCFDLEEFFLDNKCLFITVTVDWLPFNLLRRRKIMEGYPYCFKLTFFMKGVKTLIFRYWNMHDSSCA